MSNNNTKQINGNNYSTASWLVPVLISSVISFGTLWVFRRNEKYNRSKWLEEVEKREKIAVEDDIVDGEDNSSETKPSVIEHFKSLELTSQSTILEANRRRTTSYYEKSREAHLQSLVLGISDYSTLLKRRQAVIDKLLSHYRAREKKSLRTVIIMVDISTQQILSEAREKILMPLFFSTDLYSRGVWIPEINIIPKQDMHVSVACPWWWYVCFVCCLHHVSSLISSFSTYVSFWLLICIPRHTMRDGNRELSQDLANRLRQTLVVDFHHPFEIGTFWINYWLVVAMYSRKVSIIDLVLWSILVVITFEFSILFRYVWFDFYSLFFLLVSFTIFSSSHLPFLPSGPLFF